MHTNLLVNDQIYCMIGQIVLFDTCGPAVYNTTDVLLENWVANKKDF